MQIDNINEIAELFSKHGMTYLKYSSDTEEIICSKQVYVNQIDKTPKKELEENTNRPLPNEELITVSKPLEKTENGVLINSEFIGMLEFTDEIAEASGEYFVEAGTILCTIEAMKLLNEIKTPVSGYVNALVKNKTLVECDQDLFWIRTDEYGDVQKNISCK